MLSRAINTAFMERENGTERQSNARQSYRFKEDRRFQTAVKYLTIN